MTRAGPRRRRKASTKSGYGDPFRQHFVRNTLMTVLVLATIADCQFLFRTKVVAPANPDLLKFTGYGFMSYFGDMQIPGNTSPGTFVYVRGGNSGTTGQMAFFESAPIPDFAHGQPVDFGPLPQDSNIPSGFDYFSGPKKVFSSIYNGFNPLKASHLLVQIDDSKKPFKATTVTLNNQGDFVNYQIFTDDIDGFSRYVRYQEGGQVYFNVENGYLSWNRKATAAVSDGPSYYFVRDAIPVGRKTFFIDDLGYYFVVDESQPSTNFPPIPPKISPDTYPVGIKLDIRRLCGDSGCYTITSEARPNNQYFLSMLKLTTSGPGGAISHDFTSLDVSTLGEISSPMQLKGFNFVALSGGGKFYLYNILEDKFELNTAFVSLVFPGLDPDSVVMGQFDTEKYPKRYPVMGLIFKENSFTESEAVMLEIALDGCVEGYRLTQSAICEECTVLGCKSCPADKDTCTECKDPSKGAINPATSKFDCTIAAPSKEEPINPAPMPTEPSPAEPTPTTPASVVWPEPLVRRDVLKNRLDLVFDSPSRYNFDVQVFDFKISRTYSCSEVGCSLEWLDNVLRISFKSKIKVSQATVKLSLKTAKAIQRADIRFIRNLESIPSQIEVPGVYIFADGWFFSWLVVAQLVLWFFRTFGSLVLFSYYPVTAMIVDQLVTQSALLSLYLGPSMTTADVAVQIVGSTQIGWYWLSNPFQKWDLATLACTTRPGHASKGLACSYLDNYGANAVGWVGLSVFMMLLHLLAKWIISWPRTNPAIKKVCQSILRDYGLKYMLARLDANQLEVMMYVLISYSLADSSSKSVVGLVLATIWLLGYLAISVLKTLLLSGLGLPPIQTKLQPSQSRLTLAPLETEGESAPISSPGNPIFRPPTSGNASMGGQPPTSSKKQACRCRIEWLVLQCLPSNSKPLKGLTSRAQMLGPGLRLVQTLSVCILLLNFTENGLLQLVLGFAIELLYLIGLWFTRTEEKWREFLPSALLQGLAVLYLLLKAVSTSGMSEEYRQGIVATLLAVLVLLAVLLSISTIILAGWSLFRRDHQPTEKREDIEKNTTFQTNLKAVSGQPDYRPDNLIVPGESGSKAENYVDLEIPEEVRDRDNLIPAPKVPGVLAHQASAPVATEQL